MRLLGLSKLPPDASRSEHLALIRQHRSVRKERVKSSSPASLKRGGSYSRVMSSGGGGGGGGEASFGSRNPGEADSASVPPSAEGEKLTIQQQQQQQCPDREEGEEVTTPHHHHDHQPSEWLDMRESSLKLTPTDMDERFLGSIESLMNQFPAPPTRDHAAAAVVDVTSPSTAALGRFKGDGRRGLPMSRPSTQWRGVSGADGAEDMSHSWQNPIYQQQMESRRGGAVREIDSPMRIRYPKDEFSL
ncbi:unnamed protein product [Ectocarpus sp. CCAP 1310/34]|nr:unnamed protein product [Ectocarpus sp. CCAP 1310/34]